MGAGRQAAPPHPFQTALTPPGLETPVIKVRHCCAAAALDRAMATNSIITVDVLNGYLSCKYKAYLRFAGQHGIKSDYEATLVELRQEVRLKAIEKIHRQFPEHTLTSNIALTDSVLKRGACFVLDAQLQDDCFSIHFDALKRADGASNL